MATEAEDIVMLLTEAGLGTLGTSLFIGATAPIPSGAGPYGSVIETPGEPDQMTQQSRQAIGRPRFQVVFRAADARAARTAAEAAYGAISAVVNRWIGTRRYLGLRALHRPFDLGPDASGRARMAFTFEATVDGQATAEASA